MPRQWAGLWMLLANARRVESGQYPEPPAPLILAAWHVAAEMKILRLEEQIRWADQYGLLDRASEFLHALTDEEWFHITME